MTLQDLFPEYPLGLRTPSGSQTRFGSRRLFVDLPWEAYNFMQYEMARAIESEISIEEVKTEWHELLHQHNNRLTFRNKPLMHVWLQHEPFSSKRSFRLRVNWDLFIEYLDEKAKTLSLEIDRSGKHILTVYNDIWSNYFYLIRDIRTIEPIYSSTDREQFRKLLKRTGDYLYINKILNQLDTLVSSIENFYENKIPSIKLYTNNMKIYIQNIKHFVDVINITAIYLPLRNIVEAIVKLIIYLKIGHSLDADLFLKIMYLYEYEISEENGKLTRKYSLNKFSKECVRKYLKINSHFSINENIDIIEVINKLKEKRLSKLGVNKNLLEEFIKEYSVEYTKINELYSACSEVIHNQPSLPFFSLLEIKILKFFLIHFVQSLKLVIENALNTELQINKIFVSTSFENKYVLKRCLQIAYELEVEHDSEIKEIIINTLRNLKQEELDFSFEPYILASFFHLLSPSRKQLRQFSIIEEDIEDIIRKIEPYLSNVSYYYVEGTLNILKEMLLPKLNGYDIFKSLATVDEKNLTIFYLLVFLFPESFLRAYRYEDF